MRQLYNAIRKLSGKYSMPEKPIKDKQGTFNMGTEQQLNGWAERFEELPNRPALQDSPDIQPAEMNLPIKC